MVDSTRIRIAAYDSSDGPRIMLFGPKDVDIKSLQDVFRRLSQGECTIALHEQAFVFSPKNIGIFLQSSKEPLELADDTSEPGIRRVDGETNLFNWKCTSDEWEYLSELLDGLITSNASGHQYLTRYPEDDAIVVVSKGEYADDVLNY